MEYIVIGAFAVGFVALILLLTMLAGKRPNSAEFFTVNDRITVIIDEETSPGYPIAIKGRGHPINLSPGEFKRVVEIVKQQGLY